MSKALAVAAVVVGVAAVVLTAGAALGFAPLIAGALGVSVGTLATITAVLGVTAAALNVAAGLLAPKPGFGSLGGAGTQLDFTADPTAGEPYVMGNARVGESVVHEASWGDKNKFLGIVGILSCAGPIMAYDGLYADNNLTTFTGGNADGYYNNFLYLLTQQGNIPEATMDMRGPDASYMPDWDTVSTPDTHRLSGFAATGLKLVADIDNGKIYSGGLPQFTHQIRGVMAYDPRLDSTNGGTGSERPGGYTVNETAYAYSENPWVHHGTFALGRWQNGVRVIGPGLPAASIDWASHIDAANIADANGWKVSGLVLSTDSKWSVLQSIAQAGGGYPIPTSGKLACLVNTPRVSLETVEEEHLKGPASVPQMAMRRDRLNGAQARYREPSLGWQVLDGNIIRNSTYLTEDGGTTKTKEIDLPLVANKDQAAQLVAYEVANSRERSPIQIELDLYWSQYKMGDCITLNLPSALLDNQKCVIIGREIDPDSNTVRFTLRTEDDAKHTWALSADGGTLPTTTVGSSAGAGDQGTQTVGEITSQILQSYVTGLTFSIAANGDITVSNHDRVYPGRIVAINGATVTHATGAAAGDIEYVYYDDSTLGGTGPTFTPTYQVLRLPGGSGDATAAFASPSNPYRHNVCGGHVPATGGTTSGGSDTGSGGGAYNGGGPNNLGSNLP